jgi:hypothetical protein
MAALPKSREQEERIRRRAYELWERDGRPEHGHEQYWLRAETELEASGFEENQGESNRVAEEPRRAEETAKAHNHDQDSKLDPKPKKKSKKAPAKRG